MDKLQLGAKTRDKKANVTKLRRDGFIPAVIYGFKVENQSLAVSRTEFEKVLRKAGESTIIDLAVEGGASHPVLIHDVQYHPVHSQAEHVDFYAVNMSEKLTASVVLEFTGESSAVKAQGGTLVKVLSEIEVECLPSDLPHNIIVDISPLVNFEHSILVKDLKVPERVTVITDAEETVVKVQPPRDVEAELAAPVVEDVSAVEGAAEDKPVAGTEAADAKSGSDKK